MKYIRTKDGIGLLRKGVDKYIVKDSDYSCEIAIDEKTLLKNYKVADTIEELCDGFVAVRENASGNNTNFFIEFEDWELWMCEYDIYGAIWTDKGLIYVAKMNDKGDLELI